MEPLIRWVTFISFSLIWACSLPPERRFRPTAPALRVAPMFLIVT